MIENDKLMGETLCGSNLKRRKRTAVDTGNETNDFRKVRQELKLEQIRSNSELEKT